MGATISISILLWLSSDFVASLSVYNALHLYYDCSKIVTILKRALTVLSSQQVYTMFCPVQQMPMTSVVRCAQAFLRTGIYKV